MKIVRAIGGLGNQMFQYAFYENLNRKYGNAKMDLGLYACNTYHNGFELNEIFGIQIDSATPKEVRKLGFYESGKISKVLRRFYRCKKTHYIEKVIGYDNKVPTYGDWYYEGYWQSEKYFGDISSEIQKIFEFPMFEDDKNISCMNLIKNNNIVSIHIRRGDYLDKRNNHFVNLGVSDYYDKAIKYMKKKFGNDIKFVVFSDDIEWARKKMSDEECIYVDWNKGKSSYKDMQLMSYCKGNIIANSTFSWWGAYLNPLEIKKVVVAPRKWYKTDFVDGKKNESQSINCQEWHTIEVKND